MTATSTTLTSSGGTPTPYLLNDAPAAGYQTTATNGVATIYTQGSTGFQVGQAILVNGVSNSAFNVTSTIASITTLTVLPTLTNPNTTQVDKITYNIPSTASLTATGGSVHVADLVTTQAFKLTVQ